MKFKTSVAALASLTLMLAAPAADQVNGWILVQQHEMNGHQTLYITPTAVRIDNQDLGYSIIADATTGKLALFSSKKHLIYWTTLVKFRNSLSQIFVAVGENPAGLKWLRDTSASGEHFKELKTSSYQSAETKTYFAGSRDGGFLAGAKRLAQVHHELVVTRDISTAPQLYDIISEMQGAPRLGAIPLKEVSQFSDTGHEKVRLETKECQRLKIDPSKWQLPACKETTKAADITSGDNAMLEDIFGK